MDRSEQYVNVSYYVLGNKDMNFTEKILYSFVRGFADGTCMASNEFIGRIMGVTPRTIRRTVGELIKKGYISRQHVYGAEGQLGRILRIKRKV